jgi:hypothetical protein
MLNVRRIPRLFGMSVVAMFCACLGNAQVRSSPNFLPTTTHAPDEFGTQDTDTTVSALGFYPAFSAQPYSTSGSLGRFGATNLDEHFYAPVEIPLGAVIDFIALNNLNDNTPNVILLSLRYRNENGAVATIATIGNTPHSTWQTDFNATALGYTYSLHFPLILDVEITSSPNLQFFGNARVIWHRSVSPPPVSAYFTDVPTSDFGFQFIEAFNAAGITVGCNTSPPQFCPDRNVTRREMAVFFAKALGLHWPN